jgi:DNA-directed RNA polymerase specialized sigma24 family protein
MSAQEQLQVRDLVDPARIKDLEYAYGRALTYAVKILRLSKADAEDAVNESACLALNTISNYRERPGATFLAWFVVILRNFVFSTYRKQVRHERKSHRAADATTPLPEPAIDIQTANARAAQRRDDLLDELSDADRLFFEVWALQRSREIDRDEAANFLGLTMEQYEAAKLRCRTAVKRAAKRVNLRPEELYSIRPRAAGSAHGGHGEEEV